MGFLNSTHTLALHTTLLVIRLVAGVTMAAAHGWGKLERLLDGNMKFADPIGMGAESSLVLTILAEFVCSIFLALGLFTRAVLLPLIFVMLVIIFIVHGDDPFSKKELPLFYLTMYVTVFLLGPGKYSLDYKMSGK